MKRGEILTLSPATIGLLTLLLGVFSFALLKPALQNRKKPGSRSYILFVTAVSMYAIFTGINFYSADSTVSIWTNKAILSTGMLIGIGWLLLGTEISTRVSVTPHLAAGVAFFSSITILVILLNPDHVVIGADAHMLGTYLAHTEGIGYTIVVFFTFLCMVAGTGLLAVESFESTGLRRQQTALLTLGIIPTIAGGVLTAYLLFVRDGVPYDYTVFGYFLTAVVFAETLSKTRFLDTTPIARRIAVSEMRDAMVTIDGDDRVVNSNRSARELFDIEDDWAGLPAADFFGPRSPVDSTPFWNELDVETEVGVTIDGEMRHFSISITPVGDRSNGSRVILLHDITQRKAQEAQLQRQRDRLDEFASVVSHDLRNPLSVIDGRVTLAQEECNSEHLDTIDTAVTRMERLIDDLRTLAREGEQVGDTERISLAELANNCWRYVDASKASLRVDVDHPIWADRSRLQQLFENLMGNAVEHGGDDVTVTVGQLEGGFYVEDDGSGIPPDQRDDVFKTGYTTSPQGTGFGLSIVEQIVDAHGWDIRVTAGTDGGARFEITGVDIGR